MAGALVPTGATGSPALAARLLSRAAVALWAATADIVEVLFTRWLCDGAAVAAACALAELALRVGRALRRAARRGLAKGRGPRPAGPAPAQPAAPRGRARTGQHRQRPGRQH